MRINKNRAYRATSTLVAMGLLAGTLSISPAVKSNYESNDSASSTATLYAGVCYDVYKLNYGASVRIARNAQIRMKSSQLLNVTDNSESTQSEEQETTAITKENISTTMYVSVDGLNYRNEPAADDDSNIKGQLSYRTKLEVTSIKNSEWVSFQIDGNTYYANSKYMSKKKPKKHKTSSTSTSSSWSGTKLNSSNGTVSGPSGVETYYNMNMSFCVQRMHRLGYNYKYWVRDDGVKMLGDSVKVASNFKIRPLGTILDTSLGKGIVVDTGGFVSWRPRGLDIATTW